MSGTRWWYLPVVQCDLERVFKKLQWHTIPVQCQENVVGGVAVYRKHSSLLLVLFIASRIAESTPYSPFSSDLSNVRIITVDNNS